GEGPLFFNLPIADVDEVACHGGRGGHFGANQVRTTALALAALEVAVRGRGAALARAQDVRIHAEAHRAAGLAPFEPGRLEDLVETLLLGLRLDQAGAWDDHGSHSRTDLLAAHHSRGGPQVLDAGVGAGADEDPIERDVLERGAGS